MKLRSYIILLFIAEFIYGQTKSFVREYIYTAGESDSKITSRAIALEQVKRILLEELGSFLQSDMTTTKYETNSHYSEVTKQNITVITAGITETKILTEKWNGETYYIKASLSVDPDNLKEKIEKIAADQTTIKEFENLKAKSDEAFAEVVRLRKELSESKSELERLTKQQRYISAAKNLSSADYLQSAIYNYHNTGDNDSVIYYCQKAIELDPRNAEAYYYQGLGFFQKFDSGENESENLTKAMNNLKQAITTKPTYAAAYALLALLTLWQAENNERDIVLESIRLFHKSISIGYHTWLNYFKLAEAYLAVDSTDKAIYFFEKSLHLDPNNQSIYYSLGKAHKKNPERAISYFYDAILLQSDYPDFWVGLGDAYCTVKDYQRAHHAYRRAIDLNTDDSSAYANYIESELALGTKKETIITILKVSGKENAARWLKKNGY